MDRVTPTLRPALETAGQQRWRDLLFLHWAVPADELRALVPSCLEIDTFDGVAYVGLVPFAMFGVRPSFLPRALAFDFLETNLRTYVHVDGRDPGVYFFSLDAASWLAVKAARIGWGLPYFHARMDLSKRPDGVYEYRSERRGPGETGRAHVHVRYRPERELGESRLDTLEHFLFERYLLHVVRKGSLYTGQVHHRPYPVYSAAIEECSESLIQAAGMKVPDAAPALSHYSTGVDVDIFALWPQATTRSP